MPMTVARPIPHDPLVAHERKHACERSMSQLVPGMSVEFDKRLVVLPPAAVPGMSVEFDTLPVVLQRPAVGCTHILAAWP